MSSKKIPPNPVLAEHKEKFFSYCRKWQDLLGLHRWRVSPSKRTTSHMAELQVDKDEDARLARILIGTDWKSADITDEELEKTALHEILHLFLHDFREACKEEPYNGGRIMAREHEVIHSLEQLIYELWHGHHVELSQELPVHRSKK